MRPNTAEDYYARIDRRGPDECWPWKGGVTSDGYGRFTYQRRKILAHRFGWKLANGPIPDGLNVLHSCDSPPCQNPAHWFLGTPAENVADMLSKGRGNRARGANHGWHVTPGITKLSATVIVEIRQARIAGEGIRALGRRYSISASHASRIINGLRWKHLT